METKAKNIEFLRFALIWGVVLFHTTLKQFSSFGTYGLSEFNKYYVGGGISICAFMTMAGFFLFLKPNYSLGVFDFVKKKWIRLAPLIIFAVFLCYLGYKFDLWRFDWGASVRASLLINAWTLANLPFLYSHLWFVSDMFLASIVYFYLGKTLDKRYLGAAIGLITLIALRIVISKYNAPNPSWIEITMMDHRVARAFFWMGIGYFLAELYNRRETIFAYNTHTHTHSRAANYLLTALEIIFFTLIMLALYRTFSRNAPTNYIVFTICFIALFWLFINRRGYFSRLLDNNFSVWLGRYSYAIYVLHFVVLHFADRVVLPMYKEWVSAHKGLTIFLICAAVMLISIAAHHLIEIPAAKLLNKIMIKKENI